MAVDNALLDVQDVLAAKLETTTGTAIALAAGDGVFNVMNASLEPEIPELERQGQGSASRLPSIAGPRAGRAKFRTEVHGLGSSGVPAWASTFLAACGWVETTGTYAPVTGSATQPTITIGKYEDGVFRSISGAKGTFTLTGESGKMCYIDWDFLGVLQADSDVAMITPTYPTINPPRFAGSAVTVGTYTPRISRFVLAANNELYLRPDAAHVSGYHACAIVDRAPTVTLDPEMEICATRDWQNLLLASTQEALSIAIGGSANNIITIAAPKAQVVKAMPASRNKVRSKDVTLRLCRSSAAGDDELSLAFS